MITLLFTLLSSLYDNGKRFVDHKPRWVFRAFVIFLISVYEIPTILVGIWKPTLTQFFFNTAIFYGIFDYVLNILEKRRWNYIESTAVIDIFWLKIGWIWQLIFKINLLIIFKTLQT